MIDYSAFQSSLNPLQQALAGYQAGDAMKQAQTAEQQQADMAQALSQFSALPNKTADDYAQMMLKFPQLSENLERTKSMMDADKQQAVQKQALDVYAALESNRPDVATDLLSRQMEAAKNAGDNMQARALEANISTIKMNPEAAKTTFGLMLSGSMGADKFAQVYGTLKGEKRADEMQPVDIAAKRAGISSTLAGDRRANELLPYEIEARKAGTYATLAGEKRADEMQPLTLRQKLAELDISEAQKNKLMVDTRKTLADIGFTEAQTKGLMDETALKIAQARQVAPIKLSADSEKKLNESATKAVASENLAGQYEKLASDLDKAIATSGSAGKAVEISKKIFGSQDDITLLRSEYMRLRNTQVINSLPPGVASDRDIQIAMEAFPEPTSDPKYISQFLKGMSKLQKFDSAANNAQTEWISQNGNLGMAARDMIVNGNLVKEGTSLSDFTKSADITKKGSLPHDAAQYAGDMQAKWDAVNAQRTQAGKLPLPESMRSQFFNDYLSDVKKKPVATPSSNSRGLTPDNAPWDKISSAFKAKGHQYYPETVAAAQRYGVDPNILAIQQGAESMYNPGANSGKAGGLTQFIPSTANKYGVQYGTHPEAVKSQIHGQAKYMSDLLKRYNGDYTLAVLAYNQGEGNVDKYLDGKQFKMTAGREYVKRILGVDLPRNGKDYG